MGGGVLTHAPADADRTPASAERPERRALLPGRPSAGPAVDIGLVLGLMVVALVVAGQAGDLTGFPKGADALGHYADVVLILRTFPHLLWNAAWYGGYPNYPGTAGPFYELAVAAGRVVTGASVTHVMLAATAAIYLVAVGSLYGFVRLVGRSRLVAGAAALLLVATPAVWGASLVGGFYPRLTAMAFADLATLVAALYVDKPTKVRFAGTALLVAGALDSHPVIGALGAAQVVLVLFALSRPSLVTRLRRVGALAAVVVGLWAWYLLPLLFHVTPFYLQGTSVPTFTHYPAAPWSSLFSSTAASGPSALGGLTPVALPLLVVLGVAAFALGRHWRRSSDPVLTLDERAVILLDAMAAGAGVDAPTADEPWRRRRQHLARPMAAAGALGIVVLGCLVYAYGGHLTGHPLSVSGVLPQQMLPYAAWPLCAAVGVLLGGIVTMADRPPLRRAASWTVLVAVAGAAVALAVTVPSYAGPAVDPAGAAQLELVHHLPPTQGTQQYRLGGGTDADTDWMSAFTSTPETGGSYRQGILDAGDQVAMEDALQLGRVPRAERQAIVDWYGIRWLYAGPGPAVYDVYQDDPSRYRLLSTVPGPGYRVYAVRHPEPVLSAVSAPTALVIGTPQTYTYVLQAMELAGAGPTTLVPVEGAPDIDDYTLADLKQFSAVVLYGFQASDPVAAADLLDAYVKSGGGLFVDVDGETALADRMAKVAPSLFPVTSWRTIGVGGLWGLQGNGSPLTAWTDLSDFSPALYATDAPWSTAVARGIGPSGRVAVHIPSGPVVLTDEDGAGHVVMSGMNLPYHINVYGNAVEARFLLLAVASVEEHAPPPRASTAGAVVSPDGASVRAPAGSTGVLFKEDDYPDWHATVDGSPATIYPAGPNMMYVPLDGAAGPVTFTYRLSGGETSATVVTLATLLGLACVVAVPTAWRRRARRALVEGRPGRRAARLLGLTVPPWQGR